MEHRGWVGGTAGLPRIERLGACLSHLGFVYFDKAAHVFCLAEDQGLIIDLTARRQYRIEDWTDRMKLRALLLGLGL
jgi:hypothetical protein